MSAHFTHETKVIKITHREASAPATTHMLELEISAVDCDPTTPINDENTPIQPLLKWPGGKRLLATQISTYLLPIEGDYYEPFLGGGAMFFHLRPSRASLSDSNEELINCYKVVRDNPEPLIEVLSRMENSEANYYKIRAATEIDPVRRSARFIYLTALSFNGIYRLNRKGQFNVPYGHKITKSHFDSSKIRRASAALAVADIRCEDFETAVDCARQGDTIYFDPPYTVAHGNNGFLKYNEQIFSWEDQQRLANVVRNLDSKGCRVIVSNAAHSSIADLYKGFHFHTVERRSLIAASSEHRKTISEYIIHN